MIVSHFEDGKVEPSRTMVPHVELDYRTLPCRSQDHALSFISGSRQFAACKFSLSSGPVGRLCGGLIAMWKSGI